MSHRAHLALMIAAEFGAFLIAAALGVALFVGQIVSPSLLVNGVLIGALLLGAVGLPRLVFRRVIGCRCPAPACVGTAYPEGAHPIIYRCRSCGHVHKTSVSEQTREGWTTPDKERP